MKQSAFALIIAIVACSSPGVARAQDAAGTPAPAPAITLQVEGGQVMTSDGGEFATASSGSTVVPGSRVMVAEGGSARLDYGNGCSMPLSKPGVHFVPATCTVATNAPRPANTGLIIAGVAGGVAVIAAAGGGGGGGDDPTPPVSR